MTSTLLASRLVMFMVLSAVCIDSVMHNACQNYDHNCFFRNVRLMNKAKNMQAQRMTRKEGKLAQSLWSQKLKQDHNRS